VTALERIEAAALRSAVPLGGGRAEHVGGALCVAQPLIPIPELNRAIPLDSQIDLQAIHAWFAGGEHVVAVPPEHAPLAGSLAKHGYRQVPSWMKFERSKDAPPPEPTLPVAETVDAADLELIFAEGTGFAEAQWPALTAIAGAPGWRCFVAWIDGEPAGMGFLFIDGEAAWCGIGMTRQAFRRRGAQSAVLAARVAAAREAGATVITTETGERVADRPSSSYNNILRAGFREAYLRPNWRSPA
jgi:GNAT superfamily N-acetyltransferase